MRLERMVNDSSYCFNARGRGIEAYELRKDSLPADLTEIKIIGRKSSTDPWTELVRLGEATQSPFLCRNNEEILTYDKNSFAHYTTTLAA